jgi:hypothetical protein
MGESGFTALRKTFLGKNGPSRKGTFRAGNPRPILMLSAAFGKRKILSAPSFSGSESGAFRTGRPGRGAGKRSEIRKTLGFF